MSDGFFFGFLGSVSSDLYGRAVSTALNQWRIWDPSYALRADPEAYDKLRRDAVVSHALYYRKLLAAGTGWFLEPSSSTPQGTQAAKIMEGLIKRLPQFGLARFNLAEAIVAGSRWARLFLDTEEIDVAGLGPKKWIVPTSLVDVDKRRLRQFRVERGTKEVHRSWLTGNGDVAARVVSDRLLDFPWQLWRPAQNRWEDANALEEGHSWVHHVVDDAEDTLGHGHGLCDDLFVYWWAKTQLLQHGLAAGERWGEGGYLVAKIKGALNAALTGQEYNARSAGYRTELKKNRAEHVFTMFGEDDLSLLEPSGTGYEIILRLIDYLDNGMTRRTLGAVLPTGGGEDVGSNARAEEEATSTALIVAHDRTLLEETIDRDLVGPLWRQNREQILAVIGAAGCEAPKFKVRTEREDDPEKAANVVATLLGAGVDLRADEVYERTGFTPPGPNDVVIKGTTAPAPGAAPPGGDAAAGFPGMPAPKPPAALGPPKPSQQDAATLDALRYVASHGLRS